MRKEKSRGIRFVTEAAFALGCLLVPALGMGCSFDPMKYFSRNACEVFNCDELFFIDDLFPLSAAPTGNAGTGGGMDMDMGEAEDEGGGHAH